MARPRKQPDEQRSERLSGIRLTPAERDHIASMVERSGVAEAEFCRRAILGQRVPVRRSKTGDARLLESQLLELNRIGVNLNQIAHAAHLGKPLAGKLEAVLSELQTILDRIAATEADA